MAYTPNFRDSRVQARVRRAIGFAAGVMSADRSQSWSTRYIDRWFGQQQNSLSRYLREHLLIETDGHWNKDTGVCKKYQLNTQGMVALAAAVGIDIENKHNTPLYPIVLQVAESEYKKELSTGEFVYNDQSSRLWHPLQNFRRDAKRAVLEQNGYEFHYDIESAAMTLIHQHSQRIPEVILDGQWLQGPMDLWLFALRDYLQNRHQRRAELAAAADIDTDTAKRIINALLAGAKLAANPTTEIFQMLNSDLARLRFLQQHDGLTALRADIKTCWDYIQPTLPRRTRLQANGRERRIPLTSQQKWGLYFDLERRVLNEVREYLRETSNAHFLEHDGWSCQRGVDLEQLQQRINERTGFRVEFEMK
jgi:hypothetical protein